MSYEKDIEITASTGWHIRPASAFAKEAKKFQSDITIIFGDKSANAKSPFKVTALGITCGSTITIKAEGEDAKEALETLVALAPTLE